MTSNRANQHNRISLTFLLAAYKAGDLTLAKKVHTSLKKDLEEQMKYYRVLGDQLTDEQLINDAAGYMQQRVGNLTDRQIQFAQDIVSTYQLQMNLNEWEKQYTGARPPATELGTPIISDTPKK